MSNQLEILCEVVNFARGTHQKTYYAQLPEREKDESPESYIKRLSPLTFDALRESRPSLYPETEIRYIASTFATDELNDLFLLPQLRSARSALVKQCIEKTGTKVALCASPMFWQYGPLFYRTCRDMQVPAALVSPRNPPVTRQVITETEASYVCGSQETLHDIFTELAEHDLTDRVQLWHFIVPLGAPAPQDIPSGSSIVEYHIFPGVALGTGKNDGTCLINDEYHVTIEGDRPLISSLTKEALPLIKYTPPRVRGEHIGSDGKLFRFWYEHS